MIVLGVVQGFALLPGISRFASTYTAARWLSLSPRHALETAWMIQMPLMGVSFLHSLIIFWQIGIPDQVLNMETALVMMGASIGGWYALRFAAYVSDRKKMWWFACYMVVPFDSVGYLSNKEMEIKMKPEYQKKRYVMSHFFMREILILLLGAVSLFLLCSLVTYHASDSSWFFYDSAQYSVRNICGVVGAQAALLLIYLFGASALWIVGLMLFVCVLIGAATHVCL